MPPSAPEVLSGMRQPRSVRLEAIRAQDEAAAQAAQVAPIAPTGVTVYISNYRRYRVQVTAPIAQLDMATGRRVTGGRMLVAQFEEGVYRDSVERDPANRKLINEALQSNPYFGAFGTGAHFWLASDMQAQTDAARVRSALDTLKTLPRETVERFVADLQQGEAEDHELPSVAPPAAKTAIRPIQ